MFKGGQRITISPLLRASLTINIWSTLTLHFLRSLICNYLPLILHILSAKSKTGEIIPSRPNRPPPLPPPFGQGGDTLAYGGGDGRTQFRRRGRHCGTLCTAKKFAFIYSQKRNCTASVSNSINHVSVSDLYISVFGLPIFLQQNRQTDQRNMCYKSLTGTWM